MPETKCGVYLPASSSGNTTAQLNRKARACGCASASHRGMTLKRVAVTAFILLVVLAVLAWRIASLYRDLPRGKGMRLVISDASAYRGSHGNRLEVSLDNPEVRVRGVQLEICDADNYLSCSGCDTTDRSSGFTCTGHEKPNGCYELLLFSFTRVIENGSGTLLRLSCDAAAEAPGGECRELLPGRLEIADEQKQPMQALVEKGRICFKDCATPADCEDSLWCYAARSCADGACRDTARCPDDGLYCNGREYCDEEARQCRRSPEPCAHCYEAGCRCDEERKRCVPAGGGKGDSI